jgi:hypothetical protein
MSKGPPGNAWAPTSQALLLRWIIPLGVPSSRITVAHSDLSQSKLFFKKCVGNEKRFNGRARVTAAKRDCLIAGRFKLVEFNAGLRLAHENLSRQNATCHLDGARFLFLFCSYAKTNRNIWRCRRIWNDIPRRMRLRANGIFRRERLGPCVGQGAFDHQTQIQMHNLQTAKSDRNPNPD